MLEKHYRLVGVLHDGASVPHDWSRLHSELMALDISIGKPNGIEIAQHLRNSGCHSQIIFLTIHRDLDFVKAAFDAGGSGYVLKSRMSTDLALAIEAVLSGKQFVSTSPAAIRHCFR